MKLLPLLAPILIIILPLLPACAAPFEPEAPACDSGRILIAPTATRPADPDIYLPPSLPSGGDDAVYCPTAVPNETPIADFPEQFITAEVANLSLDMADQDLAATAVGDDMMAVGWISDGGVYVALSRGGGRFQARRVDDGESVSLAFSKINRLHMVYGQGGQILYRAADQGIHPADVPSITVNDPTTPVINGSHPKVVVDELNWAHVLYEQEGSIYKAKHLSNDVWLTRFVAYGSNPTAMPFYNEKETILFGIPTGIAWFGIIMAAPYNGEIRVFRYLSWFNIWEQIASFPIPAGDELTGNAGLDYMVVSDDEAWVYATWTTKRPFTQPPLPLYSQPVYEAANPLYPDQIANPDQIYAGLNAARWRADETPFNAGLKQTVNVDNPNAAITFEAQGLAISDAALALRIGVDPGGGDSPAGESVVWSAAASPTDFAHFSLSVPAAGNAATLFLEATLNDSNAAGTAVWDAATLSNGSLTNGGFEGEFVSQDSIIDPEGWTAYYEDGGNAPISGRDVYTVYAAWSADGGSNWSAPQAVVENRGLSGSTSGAIRPDAAPLISTATETPSVSFFYIYEAGDPPPGSDFLRFGRPYTTICDLGTTDCSDAPGTPLLPRNVARPAYRLLVAADPFNPDRALLSWDGLQTDNLNKDIYAAYATLR